MGEGNNPEALREGRRLLDHPLGDVPADLGLIPCRSSRVDFGAGLPVEGQHVKPNAGSLNRFPVLPRQDDQSFAKAAEALLVHPAEDGGEPEALVGLQRDRPAFPAALDVRQQLDESADAVSALDIELPEPLLPLAVVELSLAGELDPAAGRDNAGNDVFGVPLADGCVILLIRL